MLDKIIILACATHYNPRLNNFNSSFENHVGWDVRILGMGRKWKSFRTKMELYRDFLKKMDSNQIIVCLDAYDVFCIKDSHHFIQEFLFYQAPIIIGYETKTCFTIYNKYIKIGVCPSIHKWKKFHNIQKDIYVNSGCIVGYAGEIYKMFDWILNYQEFIIYDDQIGVGFYMNNFPHKVQLDIYEKFVINDTFGSTYKIDKINGIIQIDDDKTKNPYFLHFPGLMYIKNHTKYKNNYYLTSYYLMNDETYFNTETIHYQNKKQQLSIMVLLLFIVFYIYKLVAKNDFRDHLN